MARAKVVVKTGSRKTSIPRKEIRRVMTELFGKKSPLPIAKKRNTSKKSIRKASKSKL